MVAFRIRAGARRWLLVGLLVVAWPAAAHAGDSGPIATDPDAGARLPGFGRRVVLDVRDLVTAPAHLSPHGWAGLAAGVAAVGVVHLFDDRLRSSVMNQNGESGRRFAERVRPLGQEGGLALLGATWLAGEVGHREGWKTTAADGFEATLISAGLLTTALKPLFGRPRPNSGDASNELGDRGASLPSGEATEAFAIASVITAHAHRRWVSAAAFATAGVVGWERLRLDAHWASDVVAGALIGGATGYWVVRRNRPGLAPDGSPPKRAEWSFAPAVGPTAHEFAIGVHARF